jgi:hypothetical protein
VSRFCACIGSPCLRYCGHGASIGGGGGSRQGGAGAPPLSFDPSAHVAAAPPRRSTTTQPATDAPFGMDMSINTLSGGTAGGAPPPLLPHAWAPVAAVSQNG